MSRDFPYWIALHDLVALIIVFGLAFALFAPMVRRMTDTARGGSCVEAIISAASWGNRRRRCSHQVTECALAHVFHAFDCNV
jgi:hypothetical protein